LSGFQRGQIVGERLARTSVTKTAILLGVARAAVSKVVMPYTNHGKTSSAKKNIGRKPKLSERDRRNLKKNVSKKSQHYCGKGDSRTQYSSRRPCFHKNSPVRTLKIQHPR